MNSHEDVKLALKRLTDKVDDDALVTPLSARICSTVIRCKDIALTCESDKLLDDGPKQENLLRKDAELDILTKQLDVFIHELPDDVKNAGEEMKQEMLSYAGEMPQPSLSPPADPSVAALSSSTNPSAASASADPTAAALSSSTNPSAASASADLNANPSPERRSSKRQGTEDSGGAAKKKREC